jgi:hypothetical protein
VERKGERRSAYRKLEGKGPLGIRRRRWEDNVKMELQDVGWEGMDWMDLAESRDKLRDLVNAIMNLIP